MNRKGCLLALFLGGLSALCAFAGASVTIREWSLSQADRFPHDPAVAPDGALWHTGMGSNTLGRLDPKSGEFRSYPQTKRFDSWPVPSGGGVIRNMAATSWGDIYIACSGVDRVGIVRVSKDKTR